MNQSSPSTNSSTTLNRELLGTLDSLSNCHRHVLPFLLTTGWSGCWSAPFSLYSRSLRQVVLSLLTGNWEYLRDGGRPLTLSARLQMTSDDSLPRDAEFVEFYSQRHVESLHRAAQLERGTTLILATRKVVIHTTEKKSSNCRLPWI